MYTPMYTSTDTPSHLQLEPYLYIPFIAIGKFMLIYFLSSKWIFVVSQML